MSTATWLFAAIGGLGAVALIVGLLGGEVFHFDGFVPLEVVAGGMAMFGLAAATAGAAMDARTAPAVFAAAGIGAAAAVPAGWLALRLGRLAQRMHTDATPVRDDLIGALGVVVTPIPAQGYGEVRVSLAGQPVKLNATADQPVAIGAEVFVISAPSETSVIVERVPAG